MPILSRYDEVAGELVAALGLPKDTLSFSLVVGG
jgi:hypothetical protein